MAAPSLKTRLPLTIAGVLLFAVGLISLLSNALLSRQFTRYVADQQRERSQALVEDIARQYGARSGAWNEDALHAIGMQAMYEGYLIRVDDARRNLVFATEEHHSTACAQMMAEITDRMKQSVDGAFVSAETPLALRGEIVGYATVSYYGPYFLSDAEFRYLSTLNRVLLLSGGLSLALSLAVGLLYARKLSAPIFSAANAAKRMAGGDYGERIRVSTNARETDELISSVNHLAESLERQQRLRRQLVSDVAHELRTPLTTVGTHMEAMIDGVWAATPERLKGCHEEMLRLNKLVGDMENLARIEGEPNLDRRPVELYALAERALEGFRAALDEKNIAAGVDGERAEVVADADRLRQVLINLIGNALAYTPEGGRMGISVWRDGGRAGFTVWDGGSGIAREHLPHVFERFYRADRSRSRLSGGSGIGLAIVKSIVEAHGGSVAAESGPEGSSFVVTIPKGGR